MRCDATPGRSCQRWITCTSTAWCTGEVAGAEISLFFLWSSSITLLPLFFLLYSSSITFSSSSLFLHQFYSIAPSLYCSSSIALPYTFLPPLLLFLHRTLFNLPQSLFLLFSSSSLFLHHSSCSTLPLLLFFLPSLSPSHLLLDSSSFTLLLYPFSITLPEASDGRWVTAQGEVLHSGLWELKV